MNRTVIGSLRCESFPYRDSLPSAVRAAWDQIQVDPQTPLFLQSDEMELAISTGAMETGFILVFYDGDQPVGVMPFMLRTRWSAEMIAPLAPDLQPLICHPGSEAEIWPALTEWFRHSGLALLRIGRYPCERFERLRDLSVEQGFTTFTRQVVPSFFMDLPESYEAYLRQLSKSSRYKVKHAEEKILADFPDAVITLDMDPDKCAKGVEELIRLSCLRWKGEKKPSVMERPSLSMLFRRFTLSAVEGGAGCVTTLRIGGETVAVATGIHVPGQSLAFYHQVGRHPSALPSQYSPGLLLAGHIIRWAIERKASRISLGQGDYAYKEWLGGKPHPQWDLTIESSPFAGKVMRKLDPAIRLTKIKLASLLNHRRKS